MKKYILGFLTIVLSASLFAQKSGTFADTRDGKTYKTVVIGTQTWFSENLNYADKSSWHYKNDSVTGKKYGRLYNYESAKSSCPSGWHLPNRMEWDTLINNTGGPDEAGINLSQWRPAIGFKALYGGRRHSSGEYFYLDQFGFFWTSSESDKYNAFAATINPGAKTIKINSYDRWAGYSVRCIKN